MSNNLLSWCSLKAYYIKKIFFFPNSQQFLFRQRKNDVSKQQHIRSAKSIKLKKHKILWCWDFVSRDILAYFSQKNINVFGITRLVLHAVEKRIWKKVWLREPKVLTFVATVYCQKIWFDSLLASRESKSGGQASLPSRR